MKYIIAEKFLCFLTLLEMIIDDIDQCEVTRFDLAETIGITVPVGYEINIKNKRYSNNPNEYGVNMSAEVILDIFKTNEIECSVKYIDGLSLKEEDMLDFIRRHFGQNKYIVFAFSYGRLYNKNELDELGHVSLLTGVVDDDTLKVYDPGPDGAGIKCINIDSMFWAMRKKGGIYIIG